ncbi:hypothetical protein [Methanoregula sp.]|uniref:hypothetical protein n=1 Tax=Methanoregula sp. TaxID=2052170 RepID=UPI0035684CB4
MTRVSEIAEHWLGLCRKPPVVHASQICIGDPTGPELAGSPDGGAGGSGMIRRGTGAAISGMKTLLRNPQLLWFSLLIGLVLAVNSIAQCWLVVFPSSSEWRFFFDTDSVRLLPPLALTFMIGLVLVFCLGFLMAGLTLSISSKKDRSVSFMQGLRQAKKYLVPLTGLSVVAALAGIWLFVYPFIVQGALFVRNPRWLLYVHPYIDLSIARLLTSFTLIFVIEFATVFCLVFLLAGLLLSIVSRDSGSVSFFQGLKTAKKYSKPLTGWSVVVALAGSLLFTTGQYSNLLSSAIWQPLSYMLNQFPINFILNYLLPPTPFIILLPPDWGLGSVLVDTLILSAINVLLFVLTLFVVPLLVLEKKSLKKAVVGSFALMRKTWAEVAACVLSLGLIVFAASLMFLLFQFSGVDHVWWDAGQMYTSYSPPSDVWIALGLLYILVLSSLVLVVATVGGIATLDLYTSAKNRQLPGSAETEPHT